VRRFKSLGRAASVIPVIVALLAGIGCNRLLTLVGDLPIRSDLEPAKRSPSRRQRGRDAFTRGVARLTIDGPSPSNPATT
jgi:hypothetical protein